MFSFHKFTVDCFSFHYLSFSLSILFILMEHPSQGFSLDYTHVTSVTMNVLNLERVWQVQIHTWGATSASVSFKMSISICYLQIPIKVWKTLKDSGSAGSVASRGGGGESANARSAKRSGLKHWWSLTLRWWSTTGSEPWKATSSLSWTL